eukprot:3490522-Pyramimonas_sp.AAC.1
MPRSASAPTRAALERWLARGKYAEGNVRASERATVTIHYALLVHLWNVPPMLHRPRRILCGPDLL